MLALSDGLTRPNPAPSARRVSRTARGGSAASRTSASSGGARERDFQEGFLERATFDAVVRALPDDLQDFARFAYLTGWRRGEVQTLGWADVDRTHGRVRLRREHSKNGEPRVLVLVGELSVLIERRWAAPVPQSKWRDRHLPVRLPPEGPPGWSDIRKAWSNACIAAGVGGTLFHDLRRSAVRNFEKAGVSQVVAMKISGHKTTSIYNATGLWTRRTSQTP